MRVNVNVSDRINDWFEVKAKELGVSKSAMMCMALNEYIDQKEGLSSFSSFKTILEQQNKVEGGK